MPSFDLRFQQSLDTSKPVNLTFGEVLAPDPVGIEYVATVSGSFKKASVSGEAQFDNAVYRGVTGQAGSAWQVAVETPLVVEHHEQIPLRAVLFTTHVDQIPERKESLASLVSQDAVPLKSATSSQWAGAIPVGTSSQSLTHALIPNRLSFGANWFEAAYIETESKAKHIQLLTNARPSVTTEYEPAKKLDGSRLSKAGVGKPTCASELTSWGGTARPAPGAYVKPPIPPVTPGDYKPPLANSVNLLFKDRLTGGADLIFGTSNYVPAKKIIPVKRVYTVINTASLKKVIGNVPLDVLGGMSMSIDVDSWTWSFNATLDASQRSIVLPSAPGQPVVVEANVNGEAFQFLIEKVRRTRTFGKDTISISGRGLSATLAEPYSGNMSFRNTEQRTAQQIMNDVLTANGVSIGWSVDWQIEDWIVPAGAWSHNGAYMSAVVAIAQAAGAFIAPDPVAKTLRVKSRNPVKPWELSTATADVEIPDSVVVTEEEGYEDRAQYDSVYVSGTLAGSVLGLVKRSGSAGDNPAPMVTDPLITAVAAARQRGIYELSKYGPVVNRTLDMPILSESGIILPGMIVKYTSDGISNTGVVNSVQVNISLPTARQQIAITSYV